MKLMRDKAILKKQSTEDDSFVDATPAERIGMVWELTRELWSLGGRQDAEQRLQRDVGNLIRQ
jgi:hypothetical protein